MNDLTTGSLSRHLLNTTAMMLAGMVLQTFSVLVDLYWVGHLVTTAVTAPGIGSNVAFIVLAATQALEVGTTSLIAQASGRAARHRAIRLRHFGGQTPGNVFRLRAGLGLENQAELRAGRSGYAQADIDLGRSSGWFSSSSDRYTQTKNALWSTTCGSA